MYTCFLRDDVIRHSNSQVAFEQQNNMHTEICTPKTNPGLMDVAIMGCTETCATSFLSRSFKYFIVKRLLSCQEAKVNLQTSCMWWLARSQPLPGSPDPRMTQSKIHICSFHNALSKLGLKQSLARLRIFILDGCTGCGCAAWTCKDLKPGLRDSLAVFVGGVRET